MTDPIELLNNVWGNLRRSGNCESINLAHRTKDGRRDTYSIGRSRSCDVLVEDKRVSSSHCLIYCDYTQVRLRVFIEDSSANGTFINDSLTRLSKGDRLELKSGDQIYLISPRNIVTKVDKMAEFTFINIRERLVAQRKIVAAPSTIPHIIDTVNEDGMGDESGKGSTNISTVAAPITASTRITNSHIEDHYIIGDQIGSGMSGQVYFCLNRSTNEQCAVKVIDTRKFTLSPGLSVSDLMEEAAIIQRLDHPNIIKVLNTFQTEHGIYIVMELLRGGDLFDRIVEKGKYSEESARKIMRKILSAVEYLHDNKIIHRDLKPENILLVSATDDTEIKLTDFGLAKKADQEGLKTFCGTPQYFAPEVLKRKSTVTGAGRYGPAADMWSLGVVLYILLSGTFPFDEDNLFDQIGRANYNMNGLEWANISVGAKHMVTSLLLLKPDKRLTVAQALKHPWISNVTYNAAALTNELGNGKTLPIYRGVSSHVKQVESTNVNAAATLVNNNSGGGGGGGGAASRKKSMKAADTAASQMAPLQLQLKQSKPHISTVSLFMTNKRPSLVSSSSVTESSVKCGSDVPVPSPSKQSPNGGDNVSAAAVSSSLTTIIGDMNVDVTLETPSLTLSIINATKTTVTAVTPRNTTAKSPPSRTAVHPPLVAKDLSEDEIEECSSVEGGDLDSAKAGQKMSSKKTDRSKKSKNGAGRKQKPSDNTKSKPASHVAVIEDSTSNLNVNSSSVVSGMTTTVLSDTSPVVPSSLKRQRSLEDSWNLGSSSSKKMVLETSTDNQLQNAHTDSAVESSNSKTKKMDATKPKSIKLLRAPVKSIAQLFKTKSTG